MVLIDLAEVGAETVDRYVLLHNVVRLLIESRVVLAEHYLRHQAHVVATTSLDGQVLVDTVAEPLHIIPVKILLVLLRKLFLLKLKLLL